MKKNVRMMALALSAMMAFGMTGCGSSDSQSAGTTAAKEENSAAAPTESEAAGESKQAAPEGATVRSEERRVGKECRL